MILQNKGIYRKEAITEFQMKINAKGRILGMVETEGLKLLVDNLGCATSEASEGSLEKARLHRSRTRGALEEKYKGRSAEIKSKRIRTYISVGGLIRIQKIKKSR